MTNIEQKGIYILVYIIIYIDGRRKEKYFDKTSRIDCTFYMSFTTPLIIHDNHYLWMMLYIKFIKQSYIIQLAQLEMACMLFTLTQQLT